MQRLSAPQGDFDLERYPSGGDETLRAWDAADELLLHHVADNNLVSATDPGSLVILNDTSGALATALAAYRPTVLTDSYLEILATQKNLDLNEVGPVDIRPGLAALSGPVDVLLAKIPRTLALLEDQLYRLRDTLSAGSVVVAAGMTKNVHTSTIETFERLIGPTTTSLAKKKARMIFATVDPAIEPAPPTWPEQFDVGPVKVISHANVFAAGKVDFGTAFLLEHLPPSSCRATIVDLGCGNGIVGVTAALANPDAEVVFLDESYRAVASAEATFRANLGPDRAAKFLIGDGLNCIDGASIDSGSVDLVLNNPPFHVHNARTDTTAWEMFVSSRRVLRPGGELWVVGNRHLGYHTKLKRIFGNCQVAASNAKFVVLRSVRR